MSFKIGDWVEVIEDHYPWFKKGDIFKVDLIDSDKDVRGHSPLPSHKDSTGPWYIKNRKIQHTTWGSALPGASDKKERPSLWNMPDFSCTTTVDKHSLAGTKDPGNHDAEFDKALKDLEQWSGSLPKQKSCECGADTIKLPFHYDWCQKYEKPGS